MYISNQYIDICGYMYQCTQHSKTVGDIPKLLSVFVHPNLGIGQGAA